MALGTYNELAEFAGDLPEPDGSDSPNPSYVLTTGSYANPLWLTSLAWSKITGAPASTGTVTSVSVVTANGVSGTVSNATTTPAITLVLGDIAPASVTATGTVSGKGLVEARPGEESSIGVIRMWMGNGSHYVDFAAPFLTGDRIVLAPDGDTSIPIIPQTLTITGPTAERTYAWPDSNATFLYSGGALGTPSSGVATNLTGTAASLTAGLVTSIGNLTGDVTSVNRVTTLTSIPAISGANLTSLNASNISSGTLAAARGGTGVSNTGTITLAGNLVTTGAFNTTFAQAASTTVALPSTSSTMARTDAGQTFTGAQTFTSDMVISSTGLDHGLCCGSSAGTIAFQASASVLATAATGPIVTLRGNTYSTNANQRGNMYFVCGNPTTPGASEGAFYVFTGADVQRLKIDKDGVSTFSYGVTCSSTLAVTGVTTLTNATATPAGGSTSARLLFGTTSGFGIYYGSGSPTVSAGQGSLYLRSDGSGIADRLYVNTTGSTTWTNFVTAA